MTKEEKLKVAAENRVKINKDFGKGTVISLGEKPDMDIETISTGSIGLDLALGVGGLPTGRIVEIYGPESSGKTTLCIHIIAEAQKADGLCAIIDAEHAFDKEYAKSLGVNVDELDFHQPAHGDEGLEIADRLIKSGVYSVVVVDSVAALVPKAELEGEMGESKMGLQARLMSQACRKLTPVVKQSNTLLIFVNQLREKIGVMFGSPETTTGGNALKFYASVRLDVRRSLTADNSVKVDGEMVGNLTRIKVIKNKVAPPFKTCEFDILFGIGIDKVGEIISIASDLELLKKWGKQITYKETKYDIEEFTNLLKDNPDFAESLRLQILEKCGISK